MTINDYFVYDSPRPGQARVLEWLERNWSNYDVFVLQCPVAAGKSGLAVTISKWINDVHGYDAGIMTPTNVLVKQYKQDFRLPTLPMVKQFASKDLYNQAKEKFKNQPIKLMNNFTLLANRAYSYCQIFDEAHELIPMLQDFEGIKIWQHIDYYPESLKTVADVLLWAASLGPKSSLGKKVIKLLEVAPTDYVINHEEEIYRGKMQKCLRIYPLTPRNNKPILWPPSKVKKMIMMSATINHQDILDLGLTDRRVGYIEVPSDIPVENRPAFLVGPGSMGRATWRSTLPLVQSKLAEISDFHGGRGFLHSTYKLADHFRNEKHINHSRANKYKELREWMRSQDDRNFVGCGLTTGLNLKGDSYHWQAILKCPFPDLSDPAVMAKSQNNPEWYAWTTIKQIVQAYGRICRSPDDYGETFILDSDINRLLEKHKHLFPEYFLEAINS